MTQQTFYKSILNSKDMKRLLLLFFLVSTLFAYGQSIDALKEVSNIKFYGVDYSQAKVYGASETPQQFKTAFNNINTLFIAEPKKYDVGKMLNQNISEVSLEAVDQVNKDINPDELMTTNKAYTLNDQQIAHAISMLPISKEPGVGMVIIAKMLDKVNNIGTYQFVFFDTATKAVITSWPTNGKAGGFGLRNFWAGSVYKALKKN